MVFNVMSDGVKNTIGHYGTTLYFAEKTLLLLNQFIHHRETCQKENTVSEFSFWQLCRPCHRAPDLWLQPLCWQSHYWIRCDDWRFPILDHTFLLTRKNVHCLPFLFISCLLLPDRACEALGQTINKLRENSTSSSVIVHNFEGMRLIQRRTVSLVDLSIYLRPAQSTIVCPTALNCSLWSSLSLQTRQVCALELLRSYLTTWHP